MLRVILLFVLFAACISVYAEYIISRPVNFYIEIAATIVVLAVTIFFLRDLIKLIIQKLKL